MELVIKQCVDNIKWDEFILKSPQSSIYMTSRILNQSKNIFEKLFFFKNNIIIGCVVIKKENTNSDFAEYQGLALSPLLGSNTVQKIFTDQFKKTESILNLLKIKYKSFNLSLNPNITDLRAFQWLNYHNEQKKILFKLSYTAIINLNNYSNFEDYLSSIRSVRRQEYKKAIKNKITVVESKNISDFLILYELTFERQGIKVNPDDLVLIRNSYNSLLKLDQARLTYAINENKTIVSGMIVYVYNDTMYYQYGATDPEYRNTGASVLIMLNNIKKGIENGFKQFDMVGVNSPNRGDFKISFNAEPKPYYHVSF